MSTSIFSTANTLVRQYFTFNDKPSTDFFLYLSGPGVYNSPAPDVETTSVPGLSGNLIRDNAKTGFRRFNNVDIKYEAFFFNGLPAKTMAVKAWLLSPVGYQILKDTYDLDFYRKAICTSAIEFSVTRQKVAEMTLTFNCKPQRYSINGDIATAYTKTCTITNPYEFYAQPLIRVYGTGEGELYVNDSTIKVYSFDDEYIDLNCETQNAYNSSGFCNSAVYSSDDFPMLAPGDNEISWDGDIDSIEVTPRWWTL